MERAERRSRAVFARPALTAPHLHLPARISDRQFLARLENAATRRKQTPEADSNRHFWQGGPPIMQCLGYAEAGNFRCLAGRQISNRQWAGGAPFAAGRVIFFGWRVAHRVVSSNSIYYYIEDMLGSSRALATSAGTLCYDADFYPYGGEHDYVNTCAQNYKFTGKEGDPETNNDDFDARYYSSAYGRFLSADWSSTPTPVPYANLTNPQTLNLYAMVSDNPESFADLDGHANFTQSNAAIGACTDSGTPACGAQIALQNAAAQNAGTAQNQTAQKDQNTQQDKKLILGVSSETKTGFPTPTGVVQEKDVSYKVGTIDSHGNFSPDTSVNGHTVSMTENKTGGNDNPTLCSPKCGPTPRQFDDSIHVSGSDKNFTTTQTFHIDGQTAPATIVRKDPATGAVSTGTHAYVTATATDVNVAYGP
jgi:RHS repeat-associated protein